MTPDSRTLLTCWLRQACLADVMSVKPGNVGPEHDFSDATADDFRKSADVCAPILASAGDCGVGRAVYRSVCATRAAVGHNTNLGILLLLAPLAAVPLTKTLSEGIGSVLAGLTADDADQVYRAIRLARPAGLGQVDDHDVAETPQVGLVECMRPAAARDLIARQYVTDFRDVLEVGLQWYRESAAIVPETQRIGWTALKFLSAYGDSLIQRKCGEAVSDQARRMAAGVLATGWPYTASGRDAWDRFDNWLRDDRHRKNPGTTADLITAVVFADLRQCGRALSGTR